MCLLFNCLRYICPPQVSGWVAVVILQYYILGPSWNVILSLYRYLARDATLPHTYRGTLHTTSHTPSVFIIINSHFKLITVR